MRLSKAVEGFALYCGSVRKMRPRSIEVYMQCLDRLDQFMKVERIENIEDVTHTIIQDFFAWLETDYEPGGWNKKSRLSSASIQKQWTVLRSFYKWASSPSYGIDLSNIMTGYPMPKVTQKPVEPFSINEVTKILLSAKPSCSKPDNTQPYLMAALRNWVIIHVLLDVGIRNSELRNLKIGDWVCGSGRLHIREGKGQKDRYVYLHDKTNYLIWQYVNARGDTKLGDWLFPLHGDRWGKGGQISKDRLVYLIRRIGARAGVSPCYPHRFRHTCAVMRVLNGQSAETLMHLLGHTTINMSMKYVNLAKVDTSRVQRSASPVDNL